MAKLSLQQDILLITLKSKALIKEAVIKELIIAHQSNYKGSTLLLSIAQVELKEIKRQIDQLEKLKNHK